MNTLVLKLGFGIALGFLPGAFAFAVEQPWVQEAIPAKTLKDNKDKPLTSIPFLGYIANLQGNVGKIGNALAILGHCRPPLFDAAEAELLEQINTLSSTSGLYKKTVLGDVYGAFNESKKLLKQAPESERSRACELTKYAVQQWELAKEGRFGEQLRRSSLVDLIVVVVDTDGKFTLGDPTGPSFAPRKPKKPGPEPGVDREYF